MARIALVISSLDGGGAERVMSGMANYWARAGHQVVLITLMKADQDDYYPIASQVRRIRLSMEGTGSAIAKVLHKLSGLIQLRRFFKETNPDVVISFVASINVMTVLASRFMDLRVVVSERTNPERNFRIKPVWRFALRHTYQYADVVVAQTARVAQYLRSQCRARVAVIPNPLRDLPELSEERDEFILSVGRLTHEKGVDILIQSFARIQVTFPHWRLIIIGDGPERAALERLAGTLNIADKIRFLGRVRNPEVWMARAGLVVQASRFEGFPNALIEAMGMGAAVISTDCPFGPAEIIDDGVNGRLVPVDDVDAMAGMMRQLMKDSQKRAALGQAALGVRERYREKVIMDAWERHFHQDGRDSI
jgi:glycosyltransferase involved in cell wall biosynthesis